MGVSDHVVVAATVLGWYTCSFLADVFFKQARHRICDFSSNNHRSRNIISFPCC